MSARYKGEPLSPADLLKIRESVPQNEGPVNRAQPSNFSNKSDSPKERLLRAKSPKPTLQIKPKIDVAMDLSREDEVPKRTGSATKNVR